MTNKIQALRGVRDLLGKELEAFNKIIALAKEVAKLFNYQEIILPIFEASEVFHRSLGEASDIVTKETYSFSDRDKRSITLRPEFTAQVVRAIINNGLTQKLPLRLFTSGPLFRHERPQKGRYRQFYQVNYEFFGSSSFKAELELLSLVAFFIKKLGLEREVTLEINSLGDQITIDRYRQKLTKFFQSRQDQLSEISQRRLLYNPLRILDSKEPEDQAIIAEAPLILDDLTTTASDHFNNLCEGLISLNINFVKNPKLVRGLDYYKGLVFEWIDKSSGRAIAAGGRYDSLVEELGGPSLPALGFAAGLDRLYELLDAKDLLDLEDKVPIYLVPIGERAENFANLFAVELREKGIKVSLDHDFTSKKRLKIANREGAKLAIIFGDQELDEGQVLLRLMDKGSELTVSLEEIEDYLMQYGKNSFLV
jgi:histidyl-tRNA synthetase